MNLEEAISACEFWTTVSTAALGSTRNAEVGAFFQADSVPAEPITNPRGPRIYAIKVPRTVEDGPFKVENLAFKMIEQEIERRHDAQQEA